METCEHALMTFKLQKPREVIRKTKKTKQLTSLKTRWAHVLAGQCPIYRCQDLFYQRRFLKFMRSNEKDLIRVESKEKVIDTSGKYTPAQVINMREGERIPWFTEKMQSIEISLKACS